MFAIADYYYRIGIEDEAGDATVTYLDYWKDLVSFTEGNLVELDNERTALVVYEEFIGQLISHGKDFQKAGVTEEAMKEQLEMIEVHLKTDFQNHDQERKALQAYLETAENIVQSIGGQEHGK